MVVTLRRSTGLSQAAVDRLGRSLGSDTVSSTCSANTKRSGEVLHTNLTMLTLHKRYRALCSWLRRPPELFRNMTLCGCRAREIAAVTSVGSNIAEQPRPSLPTGQTSGIVPQSRLHWRRLVSTVMEGGALQGTGEGRQYQSLVHEDTPPHRLLHNPAAPDPV